MTQDTEKTVYMVTINTDLTEGRGGVYAKYHCTTEATARRLAKGADVQGTDGRVTPVKLLHINGYWYAPMPLITEPSKEDLIEDERLVAMRARQQLHDAAIAAARAAGLSEEHIAALKA